MRPLHQPILTGTRRKDILVPRSSKSFQPTTTGHALHILSLSLAHSLFDSSLSLSLSLSLPNADPNPLVRDDNDHHHQFIVGKVHLVHSSGERVGPLKPIPAPPVCRSERSFGLRTLKNSGRRRPRSRCVLIV